MKVTPTALPEVLLLEPRVFEDPRGAVWESYNRRSFAQATGIDVEFVQDNHSRSRRNILRGLHYQLGRPQGKLVRVVHGEIYDVAVDLRRSSPSFGRWAGFRLSQSSSTMAWIPPGFGHGLLALSETAEVLYKMTDFWSREDERAVLWSDPQIGVKWPIAGAPILSEKDAKAPSLAQAEVFP